MGVGGGGGVCFTVLSVYSDEGGQTCLFDGSENLQISLTVMRVGRCVCLTTVSVGRSVCLKATIVGS